MEVEIQMKILVGKFGVASLALSMVASVLTVSAETEVDIRGMQSKSKNQVMRLVGGRLVYIREKKASTWRANDAAFIVQQILRNDGFYEVSVEGKIESPDRIVLIVDEGRRLTLGKVTMTGDGDSKALAETFTAPFEGDTPFGAGSPPFRADDVPTALNFVTRQLQAEGYWNAEVSMIAQEIDKQTGEVDMTVKVDQGPQFKIGRPSVNSPDGRGVKRAATTWEPFIGMWATTENINGMRAAVEEAFVSRGYPDAKITMTRRLGYDTYTPDFVIELGTRVKLVDVRVDGLQRTNPDRVKQIMEPLLEDEWYDQAAMNEKVKALLGTGAFKSVRVETSEVARKRIAATLSFEEAKAKEISLAGGFGTFDGPLFRTQYIDRNFRGMLRGFSLGTEISGRGVLGELKLTDPWWRGTDILRTHRLYSLIKAYDGYTTYETGFETSWKRDLTEHYSMEILAGYSYVSVSEEGLPTTLLGETTYGHARLAFTQSLDYRDSKILPKSGWHLNLPLQIGASIGEDTSTYAKVGIDGGYYYPINDTYHFGIGGFAKLVLPSSGIQQLPVDLRLFNGGPRSVRSFPERELGPLFAGDPYGGEFSWVVNHELSRNITSLIQAVAFVDVGGLSGNYVGARQGGVEIAAGLGVRLELPIGPVRLEYGHNLTKGANEPTGTWHFAIGATF